MGSKLLLLGLSLCCRVVVAGDTASLASCFEEREIYGPVVSNLDIDKASFKSDKALLDEFNRAELSWDPIVSLLTFCTDPQYNFIKSVQVGLTNSVNWKTQLLDEHQGFDPNNTSFIQKLNCATYLLEGDKMRVSFLEVGYLDKVGVIWLRFELTRPGKNAATGETPRVFVTVGETHPAMIKSAMVLGKEDKFIGFKSGRVTNRSSPGLAIVVNTCSKPVEKEADEKWYVASYNFMEENKTWVIIAAIGTLIVCILILCLCCDYWTKKQEIKRIKQEQAHLTEDNGDKAGEKQGQEKVPREEVPE